MNTTELLKNFEKIFDTTRCMNYLSKINENDRYFNFKAFEKTAKNCADFMEKAGLEDIELLAVKADGKTSYGDWVVPKAWDVESAVLKSTDNNIIFADYNQTPCSLIMNSAPTPKGGITAEIVIIEYKSDSWDLDLDLKGKIIFTSAAAGSVVDIAKKHGAIGIISDFIPLYKNIRDNLGEMQDISRWDNTFNTSADNNGLFAFSISPKNGKLLRKLISENKAANKSLNLFAEVNTNIYDGECYTVSGKIKGESEDSGSICIYGHLYEPGAHDNSSGCAVILELAACINDAIKNNILPKPKRTLNFIMGYECAGSMAWITKKDRNPVGGFVADMIGTDIIDNTHMCIWHAPVSNLSFADAYIDNVIEAYKNLKNLNFEWESKEFSIGTDNMLGDPYFKMPSAAMLAEPALSYHSSMDTIDRIEKDVIARNGIIIGAYLFNLAIIENKEESENLWNMTVKYIDDYIENIYLSKPEEAVNIKNILKRAVLNDAKKSIIALNPKYTPDEIKISEISEILPPDYAKDKALLVPVRKVAGCLTFDSRPELKKSWQPAWSGKYNLPLFWADGNRNLWDITILSAAELGEYSSDDLQKRWEWLSKFFEFLADNGYLAFE